jgi:hypothetical protein
MVGLLEIELLEVLLENDNGVTDEKVGEVCCERGIHAAIHKLLLDIRVEYEAWVEVLLA